MRFCKMNGAGNDFIILNNMVEHLPHEVFPAMAKVLCHRHLSIGADGLMVVETPEHGGDYRMLFYNSDGSTGETAPAASAAMGTNSVWPGKPSAWRAPRDLSPASGLISATTGSV